MGKSRGIAPLLGLALLAACSKSPPAKLSVTSEARLTPDQQQALDVCTAAQQALMDGDGAAMARVSTKANSKDLEKMPSMVMKMISKLFPDHYAVKSVRPGAQADSLMFIFVSSSGMAGNCTVLHEDGGLKVGGINWGTEAEKENKAAEKMPAAPGGNAPSSSSASPPANAGPTLTGSIQDAPLTQPVVELGYSSQTLTINEGEEFIPDVGVTVFLFHTGIDGVPAGKTLDIGPDAGFDSPNIHVHAKRKGAPTQMYMGKCTLHLAFGQLQGDRLPGTISLTTPDPSTHIEGAFVARITGHEGRIAMDPKVNQTETLQYLARQYLSQKYGPGVEVVKFGSSMMSNASETSGTGSTDVTYKVGTGSAQDQTLQFTRDAHGWKLKQGA